MTIRNWHVGKLIILWAWGGLISGLMLTNFMGRPVGYSPAIHLVELLTTAVILAGLSTITWRWLGGKEPK